MSSGPLLVYFSSTSENTHRFVGKLGFPTARIPLRRTDPPLTVDEEYVLVVPTYGGGSVRLRGMRAVGKPSLPTNRCVFSEVEEK